jgi:hypothetical protein
MRRLSRTPSLLVDLSARLMALLLWSAFVFMFTRFVWMRRAWAPTYMFVFDAVIILIGVWMVVDLILHCTRRDEPVVEIDRSSLTYGDVARVHLMASHPESLSDLRVTLIGECLATSTLDFTEHRLTNAWRQRCYEQELLRLAPSGQGPVNRTMNLFLPLSAPADAMRWTIVVGTRLKQGGGVVEYPYPLPVQERRLPAGRV